MTTNDKTGFTLGWSQLTQNQRKILKKEIMDLLEIKSDTGFSFVKRGTTRLNKAEKICITALFRQFRVKDVFGSEEKIIKISEPFYESIKKTLNIQ